MDHPDGRSLRRTGGDRELALQTPIGAPALFFAILVLSGGTKPSAGFDTERQEDDQHVGVDQGVHRGGLHHGMASYTRTRTHLGTPIFLGMPIFWANFRRVAKKICELA